MRPSNYKIVSKRPPALAASATVLLFLLNTPVHAQEAEETIQLPQITVQGKQETRSLGSKVSAGALGTRALIDTPFAITGISAREIQERQASDLNAVFNYDASTSANNSGRQTQNGAIVKIRGLTPTPLDGYKIDGLAFPNWFLDLQLDHFEDVELLKGVGGFAYGFGAPGGVFNYNSKRPTDTRLLSVGLGYKSDSIFSTHLDAGGRFGENKRFGYRFNLVHEEGDSYNDGHVRKDSVSLSLDARLTRDLTLTYDTFYLDYDLDGFSGSMAEDSNFSTYNTIDGRTRTGVPGLYKKSNMFLNTVGLEWRASPDWTLKTAYRNGRFLMENANIFQRVINNAGDYNTFRSFSEREFHYDAFRTALDGSVKTGTLRHQIAVGVEWLKVIQGDDRNVDGSTLIGTGNLNRPSTLTHNFVFNPSPYRLADYEQKALFINDTVDLNAQWSVLLGARYTDYAQNGYTTTGLSSMAYKGRHLTPTLGVVYKPLENTSIYANLVTKSMQAGGSNIRPSLTNYGQPFPPLSSKQYEIGIKTEQEKWRATAALFRIEKGAEYVANNRLEQDGVIRHQGVEANVFWRPTSRVSVNSSLAWIDATYHEGTAFEGKRVEGVSRVQAAAFVDYRLPQVAGLSVNAGTRYVGSTFSDGGNTRPLKAFSLVDVGAGYVTQIDGKQVTFRAALRNLLDREYWTAPGNSWIQPGEPRNLTLSAKIDF